MIELENYRIKRALFHKHTSHKDQGLMGNDDIRFYSSIVCEKNKDHILNIIAPIFSTFTNILEIGSGIGNLGVYFAKNMHNIQWHTSDYVEYLDAIKAQVSNSQLPNISEPFALDIVKYHWPKIAIDAVFTANTFHMMNDNMLANFFKEVNSALDKWGSLVVYGPFLHSESFFIKSDEQLNKWLKNRNAQCGIKQFDEVVTLAKRNGLQLIMDYDMPDNNQILHFIKV
ncbi:MAG: DUF938 domain-containing protein [Gammaproteobacteria bacterium]|nr:DUF938 domain-containing protein [Gammaproteobacteria bacterium]